MLSRVVRPLTRVAQRAKGSRQYHDEKPYKYPSMDDCPVPSGSWQANYDAFQKKYNMQLIAGIVLFIGTITFGNLSGAFFFNSGPPKPKQVKQD